MHDVTKRGLALAVATGGLLITGAAPALSAVHHPEHQDTDGTKSLLHGSSSKAARPAPVAVGSPKAVSGSKPYTGRHKAPRSEHATTTPHKAPAPAAPAHAAPAHAAPAHAAPAHTAPAHAAPPHKGPAHKAPAHAAPAPHHRPAPVMPPPPATSPLPAQTPAATAAGALAQADASGSSGSLLTNNTVEVPIHAPVNLCGVQAAVLGGGSGALDETCVNGPHKDGGTTTAAYAATGGDSGALNDNVVQVPITIPANVCGDSLAVAGGWDPVAGILCVNEGPATSSTAVAHTSNADGIGNANVVQVPVDVPVNLCGVTANVIAVHDRAAGDTCANGGPHALPGTVAGASAAAATAGSNGFADANIVQVPIQAPLDVCGDTLNVIGADNPALGNLCVNSTRGGAAAVGAAHGNTGLATGNVAQVPVNVPAEVCGITAGVIGVDNPALDNVCADEDRAAWFRSRETAAGAPGAWADAGIVGEPGILTGNAAQAPLDLPLQLCGITAGVFDAFSPSTGTGCGTGPAAGPPLPAGCETSWPYAPPVEARDHDTSIAKVMAPSTTVADASQHDTLQRLPHTGADVLGLAGIGAGALLVGTGAVAAARRKQGSANQR